MSTRSRNIAAQVIGQSLFGGNTLAGARRGFGKACDLLCRRQTSGLDTDARSLALLGARVRLAEAGGELQEAADALKQSVEVLLEKNEHELKLKTERVIVFKDGYSLIVKRGSAVTLVTLVMTHQFGKRFRRESRDPIRARHASPTASSGAADAESPSIAGYLVNM